MGIMVYLGMRNDKDDDKKRPGNEE
jgi:hypothetical protein